MAQAFAVAQTVYYDNQHLQLDQNRDLQRMQDKIKSRIQQKNSAPKYHPNFDYNKPQQSTQPKSSNKPQPMEVDTSNRFKQQTNWRQPNQQADQQPNGPIKRDYNSSRQYAQQPQKMQRINQSGDNESNPNEGYEGDICGEIPDDLISNTSDVSTLTSAFLEQ